jgi:hypothetical protein
MKKIILTTIMLFSGFLAFGQVDEENNEKYQQQDQIKTLFPHQGRGSVGGYGALSLLYTAIDDHDAIVFGARGAALLGHSLAIGLSGSGFINDPKYYSTMTDKVSLTGGYGGLFFEPIVFPKFPVHVAFPVTVGAGGITAARFYDYNDYDDYYPEEVDAFFVVEPGVELELNITHFCRFTIGGYYRYTTDVNMIIDGATIPGDVLRGFSGGVNFKFGRF